MELEDKYLVLKWADIDSGLTPIEQSNLITLIRNINNYRRMMGKPVNRYVVINEDEPYFADVLKLMEGQS